jgi:uncharacterized membrane protein
MDTAAYLKELDKELKGLTNEDKQNILAYYNEYLIDAEDEVDGEFDANVVLGSPHTLAAQIRADIAMAPLAQEPGATSQGFGYQQVPSGQTISQYSQASVGVEGQQAFAGQNAGAYQQGQPQGQKKKSELGIIWAVILGILAIPVGIPLAIALVLLIFSVLITLFSLLISLGAVALGLFIAGIIFVFAGIFLLFVSPPVGIFYIGSGLVVLGFFVLLAVAFGVLGRLSIRGVAKLFNAIRVKLSRRERVTQ